MRCGEWLGPFQCELEQGHKGDHMFDSPLNEFAITDGIDPLNGPELDK